MVTLDHGVSGCSEYGCDVNRFSHTLDCLDNEQASQNEFCEISPDCTSKLMYLRTRFDGPVASRYLSSRDLMSGLVMTPRPSTGEIVANEPSRFISQLVNMG